MRTKGAKSQWKFDNILSDLKDDELDFMDLKYNKQLLDYRISHNMKNQHNQREYLKLQQRKKMITEEKRNRKIIKSKLIRDEIRFYPNEGNMVDSLNNIKECIAYNRDETDIINLPSGNMGTKKVEIWTPIVDKSDVPYTYLSDVELSWKEWIRKYKLDEPYNY